VARAKPRNIILTGLASQLLKDKLLITVARKMKEGAD